MLFLEARIIPICHSPCLTNKFAFSQEKSRGKKKARLNLSPSCVLQTVLPHLLFYLRDSPSSEPQCLNNKVALEVAVRGLLHS